MREEEESQGCGKWQKDGKEKKMEKIDLETVRETGRRRGKMEKTKRQRDIDGRKDKLDGGGDKREG